MSVKVIQRDTFEVIRAAINKTVDLIKPTYGPASNKVIIAKVTHGMVVDDGVQIARDLELEDPAEHAGMKVARGRPQNRKAPEGRVRAMQGTAPETSQARQNKRGAS